MRPRVARRIRARWPWLIALALPACAASPPSRPETAVIRQIREEYFRVYPEGRYNDHIVRSEIVKGMSLYEVLASWGIPDERAVSTLRNRERWSYVILDDNAVDWVRYEFVFAGNEMIEWEASPNVASGRALDAMRESAPAPPLPSWVRNALSPSSSVR
jgi:hypothetical protein